MPYGFDRPWERGGTGFSLEGTWLTFDSKVEGLCRNCGRSEIFKACQTRRYWLGQISHQYGFGCKACNNFTTYRPNPPKNIPPRKLTPQEEAKERIAAEAHAKMLDDFTAGIRDFFQKSRHSGVAFLQFGEVVKRGQKAKGEKK